MSRKHESSGACLDTISESVRKARGALGVIQAVNTAAAERGEMFQVRQDVMDGFLWMLDDLLFEAAEAVDDRLEIEVATQRRRGKGAGS